MIKSLPIKKEAIESALTELKTVHGNKDLAGIEAAVQKLNDAWAAASQELYNAQQADGGAANNAGGNADNAAGAEDGKGPVQDVDFEEVK